MARELNLSIARDGELCVTFEVVLAAGAPVIAKDIKCGLEGS